MFRALSAFILFRILGWKVSGQFPESINKYIVIVAPHTSNWDFVIGVFGRAVLPEVRKAKFLGKKELFKPPFGWIFRALGGYPVDRSKNTNMVDTIVDIFNENEEFVLALAPEGTRKKVKKFKTGFYFIAQKSEIPIVMVGFDYGKKEIIIREPFYPSTDFETDMEAIMSFFSGIKGKISEFGIN